MATFAQKEKTPEPTEMSVESFKNGITQLVVLLNLLEGNYKKVADLAFSEEKVGELVQSVLIAFASHLDEVNPSSGKKYGIELSDAFSKGNREEVVSTLQSLIGEFKPNEKEIDTRKLISSFLSATGPSLLRINADGEVMFSVFALKNIPPEYLKTVRDYLAGKGIPIETWEEAERRIKGLGFYLRKEDKLGKALGALWDIIQRFGPRTGLELFAMNREWEIQKTRKNLKEEMEKILQFLVKTT